MPEFYDSIMNPAHYCVYPVQPIEISRHLNFCLGNAVKYVLRAPYKGGVEDCEKAERYLYLENQQEKKSILLSDYSLAHDALEKLVLWLAQTEGDHLWEDISNCQIDFLQELDAYLLGERDIEVFFPIVHRFTVTLNRRDDKHKCYESMTGLPKNQEDSQ